MVEDSRPEADDYDEPAHATGSRTPSEIENDYVTIADEPLELEWDGPGEGPKVSAGAPGPGAGAAPDGPELTNGELAAAIAYLDALEDQGHEGVGATAPDATPNGAASGPRSTGGNTPPAADEPLPPPPEPPTVADAAADLIQTTIDYARQEAESLMAEKVVAPLQKLGLALSSASAAGCLAALGIGFLSVAALLLLAGWLGWPGALALIGVVLLIGSGIFTYIKYQNLQVPKEPPPPAPGPSGSLATPASVHPTQGAPAAPVSSDPQSRSV